MLDQIKAFQKEAKALGRNENSVEEFKLWIESESQSQSQTKQAAEPEEDYDEDRKKVMGDIKKEIDFVLENSFPELENLETVMFFEDNDPVIKVRFIGR
jgi:hypothetical protein